jgi:hypothetical protein
MKADGDCRDQSGQRAVAIRWMWTVHLRLSATTISGTPLSTLPLLILPMRFEGGSGAQTAPGEALQTRFRADSLQR